jgi:flagellar protein FliO/FliZ
MDGGASFVAQAAGMLLALVLVLGLAWLCLAVLKRLQLGRLPAGASAAQVVGSVSLGPRERVVTLRWHGRDYLLGVTPAAIQVIDQRQAEPLPAMPPAIAPTTTP